MPIFVDENVVGLEITMDEVHFVDRFNREDCLGDIEATLLFTKNVLSHQQGHEVTSREKVHYQVEVFIILKTELEVDNPRVLGFHQYLSFCFDVVDLVLIDHFCLFHPLDGDDLSGFDVAADPYFTERTSSDN
eukprot:CAMPEP_0170481370 /NCGR_PEP_ID=MMETSP0208-20121228/1835_1 /TAXON_ID=197538 /ORGANISM="Strombidium inclinatum, Strain S3" /LENGTH=132 /DNA_ID=CAMNT_0010754057 /DNA_START=1440 /DNA_END=1838 /DNA_ORIENTATION=-